MYGVDHLIAVRRSGDAPFMVHIDTDPGMLRFDRLMPFDPNHPRLSLQPEESLRRLDLRCVVGLFVEVTGCNGDRVDATVKACIQAGAKRVIGHVMRSVGAGEFSRFESVRMTDTTEEMTWQEP